MLELEEAVSRILASLPPPTIEATPVSLACGRVLAKTLSSPLDLPSFDNSSVDGYAVRAEEVAAAGANRPVRLRLTGKVPAGASFDRELASGECIRIFTGSPLPRGADCVVMQEDTRLDPARPDEVFIVDSARPWENVRFRGEDIRSGATLAEEGERLAAGRLALLAAVGVGEVEVNRRPRVAILATGSELREPGAPLAAGQIYESNRVALAALIAEAGGVPNVLPIVPDDPESTRAAMERALAENDLVTTCGGVSVGEFDFVKHAFERLGGKLEFWKVAIKPGRPFVFGRLQEKLLFGLPGNPVSAIVTFLLLVWPALLRWQGARAAGLPAQTGVLVEPLANDGRRRHFMRVYLDEVGKVRSAGFQASHVLKSLASANGLVDVPPGVTFPAGSTVTVLRW